jgi:hypothetical protein
MEWGRHGDQQLHHGAPGVLEAAVGDDKTTRIESFVDSLEGLADISELTTLLKGG